MLNRYTTGYEFDKVFQYNGYAKDTYINGNKTHCAEYLQDLWRTGSTGRKCVIQELTSIKQESESAYKFLIEKLEL